MANTDIRFIDVLLSRWKISTTYANDKASKTKWKNLSKYYCFYFVVLS